MVKETELIEDSLDFNRFTVHGYCHLDFMTTDEQSGKQERVLGDQVHLSVLSDKSNFVGSKVGKKFFPGHFDWEIGATYEPKIKLDFVDGKLAAKIVGYKVVKE